METLTKTIRMSGASDDTVIIDGAFEHQHSIRSECYPIRSMMDFIIGDETCGLRVRFEYAPAWLEDDVWIATVATVRENTKCPWPVRLFVNRYATSVEIDCPISTPIRRIG